MRGSRWRSGIADAGGRERRVRWPSTLGAVVLAGCAHGLGGRRDGALTVYSGQHVQTTQALVAAFEKRPASRSTCAVDDEDVLADQIVTEGSHSPADVFFTENSPPLQYLASKGLLAPVDPSTLANTPVALQLPGREVGRRVGPGERDGLQHLAAQARASCRRRPWTWPTRSGRARSPSPAPRRTSSPSSRRIARDPRRGGRAAVARGGQGERREPRLPRQRDDHLGGQQRPGRPRHHQPVLLVPRAGPGGRVGHALGHRLLRPARRRLRGRRLGRRHPEVVDATRPRRSASWPS